MEVGGQPDRFVLGWDHGTAVSWEGGDNQPGLSWSGIMGEVCPGMGGTTRFVLGWDYGGAVS